MKKFVVLLLLISAISAIKAQDSLKYKLADFYHDSAQSAFDLKNYDTACKYTRLHLDLELSFDVPRQLPVIESYITNAFCAFREGEYKKSIEIYNQALGWMDNATSAGFSKSFFKFINLCYKQLEAEDQVFFEYTDKDYRKTFIFTIEEVLWRKGTKFRVRINAGLNDGLIKGAVAFPISAVLPDSVEERKFQLGTGEIIQVDAWTAEAEVDIYDSTDIYNWVQEGDMIETRILSKFKDETILYKLLATNVFFKDNERELFVNPRYILHYDSKIFHELMLLLMADQVAETEEFTREGDLFLDPAPKGQNTGKSIHDLFLDPDTSDINDFLEFVRAFPRKYMGKAYKVNETYATWLLNNSPSTPTVILDSLLITNSIQRQWEILDFNQTDLTKDFYETWGEKADDFADKQQFERANKTTAAILLVAKYLNNKTIQAYGYHQSGKILKQQKKYGTAISYYDSAAKTYLQMGDTVEYARAVYKKGSVYGDWSRYKEAVDNYETAEKILRKKIGKRDNYEQSNLLAYILWDKGYTIAQKGDNEGAIKAYDEAEKILNKIDGSKTDRATLTRNIAVVAKNKGLYDEALEKFKTSGTLFYQAGNSAKYARAYDDIADTYFKMGKYRDAIANYTSAYQIKQSLDDKSGAGFSKSNIGQAYWNLGEYDSAILSHKEAVQLRSEVNDVVGMAYSYEKTADLWKENGNVDSSIHYYKTAEQLYISNNDTTDKLASLKESVGKLYYNQKNYDLAIQNYNQALLQYQSIGNNVGIASCLYNIGLCNYYIKAYNTAQEYLQQAKTKYEQIGDKESIMYTTIYLSLVQWNGASNFGEAEKLMDKALQLAKQSNSLTNQGYAYNQLGILKQNQGQFELSKKYYDSSINTYTLSEDYEGINYTRLNLGRYFMDRGEFSKTRELYWQVANEATEKKNNLLAASALGSLADYYNLVGEYDSAKYVANSAMQLNVELKNEYIEAGTYISLGNTYSTLTEYKAAVKYYYLADSIYKAAKDPFGRAVPINNIGTIYFFQGDYRNALIQFYDVYNEMEKMGYKGDLMLTALVNLGETYLEDGLFTEADTWLKRALELSQKQKQNRRIAIANLLYGKLKTNQKKYAEAKKYLFTAYTLYTQIGEQERILETSTLLGRYYFETNKPDSAQYYLAKALNVGEKLGASYYLWEPLYINAKVSLAQKDTLQAIQSYKKSVDVLENIKKNITGMRNDKLATFAKAGQKYKIYQELVSLLVSQNDVKAAFFYQEKSNIAGLNSQTRGGDNGPTRSNELLGGLQEETVAKELELKIDGYYAELIKERSKPKEKQSAEKIKTLEGLVDVNEVNYSKFIDSAMKATGNEETVNFSTTINPRDLDDARFSLGDDDAVVEYLLTNEQLLIFVATNNSLNVRKVSINEKELTEVINQYYQQVSTYKSDKETVIKNSQKLYQIFISPITDLIEGRTRLALVPTGVLYKLPIQSLGTLENGKMKYLISSYAITYISNLKFVYQANASTGNPELKIVAFGNADKTLSNAEDEVNNIVVCFPTTIKFLQDSATEDKAKTLMNSYNVVHFATHGRLNPVDFENSYLVLAPNLANGDDGKLTMKEIREISSLRNIKLLVLSACNTAVKEEQVEGWVNTPANVFILKGVSTVIASQWQVHDEATGVLMKEFYTLLKSGMPYSAALKTAQITLSETEKFAHPYYWSAFETIGKW